MSIQYPTQAVYKKAMEAADSGESESLMNYLVLFPMLNARLRGHILTRKTAVGSWDWGINAFDKNDQEKADAVKYRLLKVINYILQQRVQTPLYGCFLCSLKWNRGDAENIPVVLKRYLPTEIQMENESQVSFKTDKGRTTVKQDDRLYIYETDGESYRGGLLRSIGLVELMRYDMTNEWANYNKKLKGIIQGIDKGADDQERLIAESALQAALTNNYMLTSDLIEFKFNQIAAAQSGGSFRDILDSLNNAIAIAILGQANTPELPNGGGSRAALQVQQMVSADIMFSDIIAAEALINGQLLRYDWLENQGEGEPPWAFNVKLAEATDMEKTASALEIASRFLPLNLQEAYELLELTPPDSPENTLAPQAQAAI
jgi:hypothetical protein